jgi:hypothetical protein
MCIRRETREKARRSLAFSRVSKPHTHITHMLRQCTSIVYICFHTKVNNFFFLKFNAKKGGKTILSPPSIFKSSEGNCPKLFRPWSGISEVRTADSYGASEFMSVRIFSCLCVSVFSFLCIRNFLSAIKYFSFCHVIYLYIYIIYICIVIKVIYWPFKFKTI